METHGRSVSAWVCISAALILAALWLFDLIALKTPVLTPFVAAHEKLPALTPIYAFWKPVLSWRALWFVAIALAFVLGAARWTRPDRTTRGMFVLALVVFAVALPLSLFAVRQGLSDLGSLLVVYRNEEVYFDALQIREYRPFLAHYVELMPQLSLHGRHFPPGHASLLYGVGQVFGTSLLPVAIVVLACSVLASVFVYMAIARTSGEVSARQGAFLLLAAPSMLDFACTSMDAVFLMFASIAWWLATPIVGGLQDREVAPVAKRCGVPLLAGVALLVATCFSFSAVPVGLSIGLGIAIAGRRPWRAAVEALALIGVGYAATALVLFASTGFALWQCLAEAKRSNLEFMSRVVGQHAHDLYAYLCYGNGAAFLIGSGIAVLAAAWSKRALGKTPRTSPWNGAILLTLAVMTFGGIYFMETERIWLYAVPWLVAIAVSRGAFTDRSLRVLLAIGCLQALAMEIFLLTLW